VAIGATDRTRQGFLCLLALLCGCLPPHVFNEQEWRARAEGARVEDLYAEHRSASGRFYNPWLLQERSFGEFLRWRLSSRSVRSDVAADRAAPSLPENGAFLREPGQPSSLTYVGHATFVLHWTGQVVVTDPFFSRRAAVVRRLVPPAFGAERIPDGAVVVLSHNHYDHLDRKSIEALAHRVTFLCPLGLEKLLRSYGAQRVEELDWWQTTTIDGTVFTCLPAQHWSRRFGQGYNESLWCSWLLEREGRRIYFGGDSGYFIGFREIGRRYPGIEVALLGIGAYEPRWFMHYAHMDVPEVLRAFRELGARFLVPTQWGVLRLGDEPAALPARVLRETAAADPALEGRLRLLPVGGRMALE
jgi:N-acyl-phosphatidylethanolamine-hydrolysing phospholipase D